ncbi:hypothetical protein LCGC14_1260060 [marine sediment metagenome]|uniref:Uncharacterized protein n=1 Tax=marine sediment metagenome TaxID=412755 RepID=A0A0F9L3H3_9ZZZZ
MFKFFLILLVLLNVVLAGDLLYLYYVGMWYDPIIWIEASEIVMLYIIGISSLITAIYLIKKAKNDC